MMEVRQVRRVGVLTEVSEGEAYGCQAHHISGAATLEPRMVVPRRLPTAVKPRRQLCRVVCKLCREVHSLGHLLCSRLP